MLKLKNISKTYVIGEFSQNALDNISVEFRQAEFVTVLGPSGCGKTTLLNVIGGLDSFQSGEIVFDNEIIKRYVPMRWDMLRNQKIGYIFQNYNLVLSKTVYENIELVLNMAGVYDKVEVEERVNYVLESVGMYNYRKRNVKALSGGQQQRVAIARALAKDPEVVLADEPTGNLDANNTFEIMSIIKKISETRLVILVTHERGLVDFYADRIIELSDGQVVNDYLNTSAMGFDHVDDRNIYLKDLNSDESLKESGIDYYFDHEKDESLNLKLVEFKGNLYVKVKSKRKIKFIDNTSEIKLIDDHYKKREISDISEYDFNLLQFKKIDSQVKKKSFIRWKTTLKAGFNRVFSKRKVVGKLFLLGYFIISAILVFQLATFGSATYVDDKDFLKTPRDLMSVNHEQKNLTYDEINDILNQIDNVELSPYFSSPNMILNFNDFYQGRARVYFEAYPVKLSYYDDVEVTYGGLPDDYYEIAIDEWVAEKLIDDKKLLDLNVNKVEELIGAEIVQNAYSSYSPNKFIISGIVKTESPIVIVEDSAIHAFIDYYSYTDIVTHGVVKERIKIVEGRNIINENEILASSVSGLNINDKIQLHYSFDIESTVVGFYEPNDEEYSYSGNSIVVSNEYFSKLQLHNINLERYNDEYLLFYVEDIEKAINDFNDLDYELYNIYEQSLAERQASIRVDNANKISQVVVILVGIVIYIFFMMRSSMLNRIKEIGVYRAIGATKRDIYKIFLSASVAWKDNLMLFKQTFTFICINNTDKVMLF